MPWLPRLDYFLLVNLFLLSVHTSSGFHPRHAHNGRHRQRILHSINDDTGSGIREVFSASESSPRASPLRGKGGFMDSITQNWMHGVCKHVTAFEGTTEIKRLKMVGDYLAFGMVDGRCSIVRLSTGDVIFKYKGHGKELSALDFDGSALVTGGFDGTIHVYETNCASASTSASNIGSAVYTLKHHNRTVTGLKIINRDHRKFGWEDAPFLIDTESNVIISCSTDRSVAAVDIISGKVLWTTSVNRTPLCLDVTPDSGYIGVGCMEGTIHFLSVKTGKEILSFQAHSSKVQSLHLKSTTELLTGSNEGIIRNWDLAGGTVSVRSSVTQPLRVIDCIFKDVIPDGEMSTDRRSSKIASTAVTKGGNKVVISSREEPEGVTNVYRFSDDRVASAVVSLQADDVKIVAAYQDGSIIVWDKQDAVVWVELKGRSNAISTVQFDAKRLIADGTYSVVVIHDFDIPFGSLSEDDFSYDIEVDVEEDEDEDYGEEDEGGNAGADGDGYPSSTA